MAFDRFVGIPFINRGRDPNRGLDCYGLVWHVLRTAFYTEVPSYADEYSDSNGESSAQALARNKGYPWGIVPPSRVRPGDVVEMLRGGKPWHVGIVIAPGWVLHTNEGTGSVCEQVDVLERIIVGYYRWLA